MRADLPSSQMQGTRQPAGILFGRKRLQAWSPLRSLASARARRLQLPRHRLPAQEHGAPRIPGSQRARLIRLSGLALWLAAWLGLSGCTARMALHTPEPATAATSSQPTQACATLFQADQLEEAAACCDGLMDLPEPTGNDFLLCGLVEQRRGNGPAALQLLHRALRANSSDEVWDHYFSLRQALQAETQATVLRLEQAGQFEEAALRLQESPPTDEPPGCELGRLWLRAGRTDRAAEAFASASAGLLPVPCALRGLGLSALADDRLEDARQISARLEELGLAALPLHSPLPVPDQLESLKDLAAMSRAELAVLLVRLGPSANRNSSQPIDLIDVEGHPLEESIAEVIARGWMLPTQDGRFCPERTVTRLELGTVLAPLLPRDQSPPRPGSSAWVWRQGFPELERLWGFSPFRELIAPAELLQPASGIETTELFLQLWHPELLAAPGS